MTEGDMVSWYHRPNGHEFEQTPGNNEGQGSGMLQSMGSRRVGYDLATEQQNTSSEWSAAGCCGVIYPSLGLLSHPTDPVPSFYLRGTLPGPKPASASAKQNPLHLCLLQHLGIPSDPGSSPCASFSSDLWTPRANEVTSSDKRR